MPVAPFVPAIAAGIGAISAMKNRKAMKEQQRAVLADKAKEREMLAEQQAKYEERIQKYEKMQFVPLDVEALKQENVYEEADLTQDVLPAADYARE